MCATAWEEEEKREKEVSHFGGSCGQCLVSVVSSTIEFKPPILFGFWKIYNMPRHWLWQANGLVSISTQSALCWTRPDSGLDCARLCAALLGVLHGESCVCVVWVVCCAVCRWQLPIHKRHTHTHMVKCVRTQREDGDKLFNQIFLTHFLLHTFCSLGARRHAAVTHAHAQ